MDIDYKKEMQQELETILDYWMKYTVDTEFGGYYGKIDNDNNADNKAQKGVVLNSRILYTFSAAYNLTKKVTYLQHAQRAYNYILKYFYDNKHGGVYWSVDFNGKPLDTKKQIYGLAFCLYGLSEYFKASENTEALEYAVKLFNAIEHYSFDKQYKGYFEAFAQNWQPIDDLRLSDKDSNEKKTMNTHLHVIEAYANLYKVSKNEKLKKCIIDLLDVFDKYIINTNGHLNLFMTENWQVKGNIISYGHDIEAAWLLLESAEIIEHDAFINLYKQHCITLTNAATEGLAADGGLWYEYEPDTKHLIKQKHNWPQAEAMVGFFQAYQITKNSLHLQQSINSWNFVKQYIKDHKNGEWFWGVEENGTPMQGQDKAGFWKCPYHNSRACIEIIKRIN
jgi:cellobiose epimerase